MQAAMLRAPGDAVVVARELVKRFGGFTAVDGLGFSVRRGECFGLLGPNGAGKSTTLKLLLGLLAPDAGSVELVGEPVPRRALEARRRVGVVPQADALDPDFTVLENLRVYGRYFGLGRRVLEQRLPELLEFAGLASRGDAAIATLSGGMKRRLSIARALVNDPEVLFLDEPTTGLDPQARHLVWDRLKRLLARGKTIVLTTHFMEEAERLCDRLVVVDHGRLVAEGSPLELIRREIEPHVVEVTGDGAADWAGRARAAALGGRIEVVGETAFAYCEESAAVAASAEAQGLRYVQRRANLEDVFLKLTGRELRD
ncbi:MAG TPA: ATP-binding cassette domain-containing protein [Quisquiliibacterium sp.]|nr:ATP-binding cassette domain-containing protein [Quisquiliibacterium sp.]